MLKNVGMFIVFLAVCCFVGGLFAGIGSCMSPTGDMYSKTVSFAFLMGRMFLVLGVGVLLFDKIKGR